MRYSLEESHARYCPTPTFDLALVVSLDDPDACFGCGRCIEECSHEVIHTTPATSSYAPEHYIEGRTTGYSHREVQRD
jgi:ferredoxin